MCNDRELVFIDEYLKDFNGTQAAIRAGFTDKATSAKSIASRMLNEPHVLLELARRRDRQMDKIELSRDRVLKEIRRIAFSSMGRVASWDETTVQLIPKDEMAEEDIAALAELQATESPGKFGTRRRTNVKLHPKLPALHELLDRIDPSEAEKRRMGMTGSGLGVQLIIDGGPTGLEVPGGPTVRVSVGA